MSRTTSKTLLRVGFALAVFCSWPPGVSIGQTVCAAASVSPISVAAGMSPTMTLITNGTIDLGNVTAASGGQTNGANQFGIKPNLGISNIKIIAQFAQELQFSMDIPSSATPGLWTLFVNDASGHEVVALDVDITPSKTPPQKCTPENCPGGRCVGNLCIGSTR
jgi:hypothetical protein